jgi:hypothetical protein
MRHGSTLPLCMTLTTKANAMNDDDEIALIWARLILAAAAFVFVLLVVGILITAGIDTAIQMLRIWK